MNEYTSTERLNKLVESANMSSARQGCEPLKAEDCEILRDYGATHAISIPGGYMGEIGNTGWFLSDSESEVLEAIIGGDQ